MGTLDNPAIATADDLLERGTPHNWHITLGAKPVSTFLLPQISHSQRVNDVLPLPPAPLVASPAPGVTLAESEDWIGEESDRVILGDDVRKPA